MADHKIVAPDRSELVRTLFPPNGLIAEVGVHRGSFATVLRDQCKPRMLFLVDCWKKLGGTYGELDPIGREMPDHVQEGLRWGVVDLFRKNRNVSLLCLLSSEAAEVFADGVLDAVYIDADHTTPGIVSDLKLWWPKVRQGGILAGHDFCTTPWIQVEEHVTKFAEAHGLDLMLSGEPEWKSWAVRKP